MRYILLTFALVSTLSFGAARFYRGQIDFAGNSVTTSFELVATMSKQTKSMTCTHTSTGSTLWVSVSGLESNCSDASEDQLLDGSIPGFALDNFPVGGTICVKTDSGTVSAGIIGCYGWWEGASP